MAEISSSNNILAFCSRCHARCSWTMMHAHEGRPRETFWVVRCNGCLHTGLAHVVKPATSAGISEPRPNKLVAFWPGERETFPLPSAVPDELEREFREAELCASTSAYRGASALLRSALEKALKLSGYTKKDGNLYHRIEAAAKDGVLTDTRRQRAHDNVRDLGNDILHDDWHEVEKPEYDSAHMYVQRILEDFYDDRDLVRKKIEATGRVVPPEPVLPDKT